MAIVSPSPLSALALLIPYIQVGLYIQLNTADPNITQLDYLMQDIIKLPGDRPVLNLAFMPTQGLQSITATMITNIVNKLKYLESMGFAVWLRYAHEMK